MSVSDFLKKHKITVGVVGTTIVLGTTYGSCQFTPAVPEEEAPVEEAAEEPAEQAPEEEAPAEEAPADEAEAPAE